MAVQKTANGCGVRVTIRCKSRSRFGYEWSNPVSNVATMLPENGMAFRRLRVAALLAGALLTTNALRLVYAADNSCVEARSSAMEKVNNAFNQNIDLFIELSASLKDEGLVPNQYPIGTPTALLRRST